MNFLLAWLLLLVIFSPLTQLTNSVKVTHTENALCVWIDESTVSMLVQQQLYD